MLLNEKSIIVLDVETLEKDLSFLSRLVLEEYGSIRGFEEYIINSFHLETLNYPRELGMLLLILKYKNKYSIDNLIDTIIFFLEDELYKKFAGEVTDFQAILKEKESLEFLYQNCEVLDFKNIKNGNIECVVYTKLNTHNIEKIKTHTITLDDIKERKEEIVKNQVDVLSEYLKDELRLLCYGKNTTNDMSKLKELIHFESNYDDAEYKNLKYFEQQKIINNTLNKVKDSILIGIVDQEIKHKALEKVQELKTKIYNPVNIKKHEQLKYFVSFITDSNIGLVHDEYLPILADIILAKYLIEDMLLFPKRFEKDIYLTDSEKIKMADIIIFNQIISKNKIHKYVLTYFTKEFDIVFNNMRLLYRYILYLNSQNQKNFIKEPLNVMPQIPINLQYHYSKIRNKLN